MALLAKSSVPSLATLTPCAAHVLSDLQAGEALLAGDACRIASNGKVMKSNGTAADANAVVDGYAAKDAPLNGHITLYRDVDFHYGSGLTPGSPYYLAATAGRLDTAPTTGGTAVIGVAMNSTVIRLRPSR